MSDEGDSEHIGQVIERALRDAFPGEVITAWVLQTAGLRPETPRDSTVYGNYSSEAPTHTIRGLVEMARDHYRTASEEP